MPFQFTCETCGKVFTRDERKYARFCSQACYFPPQVEIPCANCGKIFSVRKSKAARRSACSIECRSSLQSRRTKGVRLHESHPGWAGGIASPYYRQFIKSECNRCGSGENLLIHHKDRDRRNSDPDNLETLCPTCHSLEHREERSILTLDDADQIRMLYAAGGVTQKALAEQFGVSRGMIGHIVRGKAWAHPD